MALMPNQTNNFRIYANGTLYIGIAECTLPNIVNQTDELRGGALAGPILVPVIGHFEDFTLTMTFFAPFPTNASATIPPGVAVRFKKGAESWSVSCFYLSRSQKLLALIHYAHSD